MENQKVCICIPARYNSSRLPGKLLYNFKNKTCLELTYNAAKQADVDEIFILTDDEKIRKQMPHANVIMTDVNCINGTERISKYLHTIPQKYDIIVNIQADEPFIDYKNINHAIKKYKESNDPNMFYLTLHQKIDDHKYLKSTSCVKVIIGHNNNVLLYSRNIIPWNKVGKINTDMDYFGFTGIYVYNRNMLEKFCTLPNTKYQMEEDIEQLKILEHGYGIKSYECPYFNEISLNDKNDYDYLLKKYS
jgi:3-deoxy-manno-octulosonate cytidylyltransferase (CMP-KDO synthetase)